MKKLLCLALSLLPCCYTAFSHEIVVHREITEHAAGSALEYSPSYGDFFAIISSDCSYQAAVDSMLEGSEREDDAYNDEGGARSYNHFYDPLTGLGLSNVPLDDRISPFGRNSFIWASTFNEPGINFYGLAGLGANLDTYNTWSWQNARDYELDGLILGSSSDRRDALTKMFRALGQVVHLLEDTSQPQHVRNQRHLKGVL